MEKSKEIVNRFKYNKKDKKRRDWVILPKNFDEDKIELVANMIINQKERETVKVLESKIDDLIAKGRIASINKDLNDGALHDNYIYGIPIATHLKRAVSLRRCHGTTLGMSLCVNNYKWVYGNLHSLAVNNLLKTYNGQNSDDNLIDLYAECDKYDDYRPVFNHSYMLMKGEDVLRQNIVDQDSINAGFKVDKNKTYVINPSFDNVMEESLYDSLFEPEYYQVFDQKDIENSNAWKFVKGQADKQMVDGYKYIDYKNLLTNAMKDNETKEDFFIRAIIRGDLKIIKGRLPYMNEYMEKAQKDLKSGVFQIEKRKHFYDSKCNLINAVQEKQA